MSEVASSGPVRDCSCLHICSATAPSCGTGTQQANLHTSGGTAKGLHIEHYLHHKKVLHRRRMVQESLYIGSWVEPIMVPLWNLFCSSLYLAGFNSNKHSFKTSVLTPIFPVSGYQYLYPGKLPRVLQPSPLLHHPIFLWTTSAMQVRLAHKSSPHTWRAGYSQALAPVPPDPSPGCLRPLPAKALSTARAIPSQNSWVPPYI